MALRRAVRSAGQTVASKTSAAPPVKTENSSKKIKQEPRSPARSNDTGLKRSPSSSATRRSKRIKVEDGETGLQSPTESDDSAAASSDVDSKSETIVVKSKSRSSSVRSDTIVVAVRDKGQSTPSKKVEAYFKNANKSPFPTFKHPKAKEAKLARKILSSLHGDRTRPDEIVASKDRAGCGDSPSVLDALVRTILSQNTSDTNSTRAKLSMDKTYGGSDNWAAIVAGGQSKLQKSIQSGGLSVVKSKVIMSILEQTKAKYGVYSLDHLHQATDDDAMREMLSFQGVGAKTASCVLLFCLQRESFAVDTHVHRITGLLGWRPKTASRDETHAHLDVMIPNEDKYALHILLVKHGKVCDECKAGGKNLGKCELRKAFRQGKVKGEAGEDVQQEEKAQIEEEEQDESS